MLLGRLFSVLQGVLLLHWQSHPSLSCVLLQGMMFGYANALALLDKDSASRLDMMQLGGFGIVSRDLELFFPNEDEQNEWDPTGKSIEEMQAFLKIWE
jgi:hypothetical protein